MTAGIALMTAASFFAGPVSGIDGEGTASSPLAVKTYANLKKALEYAGSGTVYVKAAGTINQTLSKDLNKIEVAGSKVLLLDSNINVKADANSILDGLIEIPKGADLLVKGVKTFSYVPYGPGKADAIFWNEGKLTIESGDYEALSSNHMTHGRCIYSRRNLTISGGTFKGQTSVNTTDSVPYVVRIAGGSAVITGGTFTNENYATDNRGRSLFVEMSDSVISGGTYEQGISTDASDFPLSDVMKEGYGLIKGLNGNLLNDQIDLKGYDTGAVLVKADVAGTPVTDAHITVKVPTIGQHPSDVWSSVTAQKGEHFTVTTLNWSDSGKKVIDKTSGTFSAASASEAGRTVYCALTVKADSGCLLKDNSGKEYMSAFVNGTAAEEVTYTNNYTATVTAKIVLAQVDLSKASVTAAAQTYTGSAITPAVTAKLGTVTLKQDTDFTAAFKNNTKVGTAAITITGKNGYKGTASGTFTIKKSTSPDPGKPVVPKHEKGEISPQAPAQLSTVETAITGLSSNSSVNGSTFSILKAKGKAKSRTSITISWKKVKGATSYIVYGNKVGKTTKMKKLKSLKGTTYTQKKLTMGKYYKYIVVAVKGKQALAVSKTIFSTTTGEKKRNYSSITLDTTKKTLSAGKSFTVKCTLKKKGRQVKSYRKACFESGNMNIATVSSNGKITAVKKGSCYIYAYAQNGIYKRVKVTVN